jgi:O-antigen/teichoic acid export membrane protein
MASAQGCALVLQFAASVVLARYLTPYETGVYAVAQATVGLLSLMQAVGLHSLIVREEVLTPEIRTTAFTVNACISIALSVCIAGMSIFGGMFLRDEGVARVILALAVTPLFGIFAFLPFAELERSGRFKTLAILATVSNLVGTIATIVLAINGFSYMSIAYAQWIGVCVLTITVSTVGHRFLSFQLGFEAWRRVGDFGLQMFAVSGIATFTARVFDIMVGRLLGLDALGIYARASGLNGLIWNNINLVIARVVFVDFVKLRRHDIPLRDRYLRTLEILTVTLWPAFAGLGIFARPFILTVYGDKWLPAALPLQFLTAASIIQIAVSLSWEVFAVTGELRAQTRVVIVRSALSLPIFLAACTISINAAAAARVLDAIIAFLLYRPHLNRMTKTSLRDFLPLYGRSALLTVLAVTPAAATTWIETSANILRLEVGAVVLGIVLWACGLLVLKHPLVEELRNFLRPLLNRLKVKIKSEAGVEP